MNEVLKTMLERSIIRAYTEEKLTETELDALKAAALSAPTAMNRQDQRFIFVTDCEKLRLFDESVLREIVESGNTDFAERIRSRGGSTTYHAPLIVIIVSKPAHFSRVDAGIAVENIALAAKSIGLDSVILGMPEGMFRGAHADELRSEFKFPEGFEFSIAIGVGHRAMDKAPHETDPDHIINV